MSRDIAGARAQVICAALRAGTAVEFTAAGPSMRPLLRPGDVLRVDPLAHDPPRPNEIVLVEHPTGLIAHRVVRQADAEIVTWGDHCLDPDPPRPIEAVLGRVTSFRRGRLKVRLDGALGRLLSAWSRRRSTHAARRPGPAGVRVEAGRPAGDQVVPRPGISFIDST